MYQPLVSAPHDLAGQAAITGDEATKLAEQLNALPVPPARQACPAVAGPQLLLIAQNADGTTAQVLADVANCRNFTNGTAVRTGTDLFSQLLLAAVPTAAVGARRVTGRATHGPGPAS